MMIHAEIKDYIQLNTPINQKNLQDLRRMLASFENFRLDFEKIYLECKE